MTSNCQVVAVTNHKGGVGKTTSVVNIAASLAKRGKKVLLVDMDPQGNATTAVGVDAHSLKGTIYNCVVDGDPLEKHLLKTSVEGLFLCPANENLVGAELELVSELGREHRFKNALQEIKHQYDFVFVDTPPTLSILTVNALVAANHLIVPVQTEFFALCGLSQLTKTVALVRKLLNPELNWAGILLTLLDRRKNLCNEVEHEIRTHFPNEVFETKIPTSVRLAEAPSHGMPVCMFDPNCSGAKAYEAATDELLSRISLPTQLRAGLFQVSLERPEASKSVRENQY